mgnify:CR=1 FL=1|tara:strand:- start:18365 stop:18730 length:366 start_codon:yes stop_codon:yes gene_type:complete
MNARVPNNKESQRVPNKQGRISNLVRFRTDDWKAIEAYVSANGLKKQEYYDRSCEAFLSAHEQDEPIQYALTPIGDGYRAINVYLLPDNHGSLRKIADETQIAIGRVVATAVLHLIQPPAE